MYLKTLIINIIDVFTTNLIIDMNIRVNTKSSILFEDLDKVFEKKNQQSKSKVKFIVYNSLKLS